MTQPSRILCFGDSLTAGYHNFGLSDHPYAQQLESVLRSTIDHPEIQVTADGLSGDVASQERFYNRLLDALESNKPNWVLVLGGTNDLARGVPPRILFDSLKSEYDLAISKGAKVLGMTIPECHVRTKRLDSSRDEVNAQIMAYKAKNYYPFDLHSKIPYHSLTKEQNRLYWDDGLHLTADGYDWMGRHIAEALLQIFAREGNVTFTEQTATSASKSAAPQEQQYPQSDPSISTKDKSKASQQQTTRSTTRKARAWKGDENTWDEETEGRGDISLGYVVVRKRDLD